MLIANTTQSHFATLSSMLVGKAGLRVLIDAALEWRKLYGKIITPFAKVIRESTKGHYGDQEER